MTDLRLRTDGVPWQQIDDEIVVLDAQRSVYLAANPSGALLWRALADGTTRDALVERLAEAFDLDRERAGADTDAFLADLRARELLEG